MEAESRSNDRWWFETQAQGGGSLETEAGRGGMLPLTKESQGQLAAGRNEEKISHKAFGGSSVLLTPGF